jgi:hypothetical protein
MLAEAIASGDEEVISEVAGSRLGQIEELLERQVRKGQVRAVLGAMNQKRINEANKHLETKVCEGIGEHVARIDATQFFAMRAIHGEDCWHDPDFIEAFMRDNPACKLNLHVAKRFNGADLTTNEHE